MTKPSLKPILLIDMDGVIADYFKGFAKKWVELYPDRPVLKPEEIHSFYFEDCYPPEWCDDIRKITTAKGFFENLEPMPGAVSALKRIMEEDEFDVFLCSTPDSHTEDHCCASEKTRWVHKTLGEEWLKKIILTHDKTLIAGDYIIDDKPLITGVNKWPFWSQVLFTHQYNKNVPGIRLNSWHDWNEVKSRILQEFSISNNRF
jgi:5'-nucleotidase